MLFLKVNLNFYNNFYFANYVVLNFQKCTKKHFFTKKI